MTDEFPKFPQQFYRAQGVTKSERYLNKLAKRSFLSLWTYSNLFNGKNQELCDLLVVFDNHVLIFSDKDREFPDTGNIDTDWQRWFKKAIKKSADQVWGAERWIKLYPERIFLDPACKYPFPLALPDSREIIFHRILVAHGVSKRYKSYFNSDTGGLKITNIIKGDEHLKSVADGGSPFMVGNINPEKGFVHIFDDRSLDVVMSELDTITDFVDYLTVKQELFEKYSIVADREEEILAFFLEFVHEGKIYRLPDNFDERTDGIRFVGGFWNSFSESQKYQEIIQAKRLSYAWDKLIEHFNYHLLDDKLYLYENIPNFNEKNFQSSEKTHRQLAKEPRVRRASLAQAYFSFVNRHKNTSIPQTRIIFSNIPSLPTYVFLVYPYNASDTLEEYRLQRLGFLLSYCFIARAERLGVKVVVGIATNPSQTKPHSEDLISLDLTEWSIEDQEFGNELRKSLKYSTTEYNDTIQRTIRLNRNDLCYCGSGRKYKNCCRKLDTGHNPR